MVSSSVTSWLGNKNSEGGKSWAVKKKWMRHWAIYLFRKCVILKTSALSQSIFPNSEVFIPHNFISSSCASQHRFLFSFFMDNQQLILTFNFSWTSSYFSWTFPQQWSFESLWSFKSSPHHFTLLLSMHFFFLHSKIIWAESHWSK